MSQLTRARWDAIWRNSWAKARKEHPTADLGRLQTATTRAVTEVYGPRPPAPQKPPLPARVGLWALGKKLKGTKPLEVPMLMQKVVVALVFGLGAISVMLNGALADGLISGQEWGELLSAFFVAFWGKFSSNTTVIAPSRKGETISGPAK